MNDVATTFLDIEATRKEVLPGGFGRSTFAVGATSPYVSRASGHWVWDQEGTRLLDINNNMTVNLHGNAHPAIVAAVEERMREGLISVGIANTDELTLARTLLDRIPWATKVRFANSGTEAVMLAVRVARATTGRGLLVALEPGYHGTSDAVLPTLGAKGIAGVPEAVQSQTLLVPRNDVAVLRQVLEQHSNDIAAVLLDLCANRAGLIPLSREFVDVASAFTASNPAQLIIDEVVTFRNAFSGLTAEYGLQPDMVVLGKTIGGGFPIGAVVGSASALERLNPRTAAGLEHGGTFTANPVTMAAGDVALTLFDASAIARLNRLTDRLGAATADDLAGTGWEFRKSGSVFRLWPAGWVPADRAAAQKELFWAHYRHGVLGTGTGLSTLSTVMDESIVDELAGKLIASAREVQP
ncbi:aminotransferase class III-fold pyridoxal phosphate-dependent enzyme [Mycetocola sp. 2940]|uniref:aminotransferase class III-fold pyridoxal phosphate-dependent enzyme n=1 Tax=Mycetocola sp. 2940 TaxID=3156452 RepID=UPI003396A320